MFRRIAYAVGFAAAAILSQAALPLATSGRLGKGESCDFHVFVPPPERFRVIAATATKAICDRLADLPGGQVAVAVDGRIVWSAGFGNADSEEGLPVTANTMFRIGSISKPLTAFAVAAAVESGSLDLDAPVQRYVPSFPRKKWTITPRQLAGHIAGIRGYIDDYEGCELIEYGALPRRGCSTCPQLELFRIGGVPLRWYRCEASNLRA